MYKVGQLSGYLTHTHICTNKSQTTMRTISARTILHKVQHLMGWSADSTPQGAALEAALEGLVS